ncbi:polysaccharide deacetylase [Planosporangium thailandense]|uniref:Polysaccharide deacetylase n=1 Tax=Planosporangium thailandense TaxID=765197 RepID=A0ABX0XS12_9ACTN|nr:polysaccharide deacetylase [Planosporangium thailandense]NJC68621.1 polysaccharide deacetylase [Planosporangium thailandense]
MITAASPVPWPDGKRAAAAFTFDVDAESGVLGASPEAASRMSVMSHQAYGPLVGVPRILSILERHDVRSTFFVPGYTAVRYPQVVRAIVDAGHEIAHHGYLHEAMAGLSEVAEAEILDRGLEAIEKAAGVTPVGYRAPMWELNYQSPALLAQRGFLYDSSLMDADVPYELAVRPGAVERNLVEIPIQWALDDWEQYCYIPDFSGSGLIESPRKAAEIWRLEFEGLRSVGGCFVLTNHPFLSGRPSRAAVLEELIAHVVSCDDVWVAPLAEIAAYVRGLGLVPRSVPQPEL